MVTAADRRRRRAGGAAAQRSGRPTPSSGRRERRCRAASAAGCSTPSTARSTTHAALPAWCSAVALLDGGGTVATAVFDPVADELFSAARGAGATLDGAPLRVAPGPVLGDAVVATFVDARRRDADVIAGTEALLRRVGALRAAGCGSLELAWLAAGRLHAWVQADVEAWDWHPGALLVAEAGGVVHVSGRWHVAAASKSLSGELLASLDADR